MAKCVNLCFLFQALLILEGVGGGAQPPDDECMPERCGGDGPPIRFPFWLKGRHHDRCGYPGFALSCSPTTNQTLLELSCSSSSSSSSSSTKVISVDDIHYESQLLFLPPSSYYQAGSCLPPQNDFDSPSASSTPFQLTYLDPGKVILSALRTYGYHGVISLFSCPSTIKNSTYLGYPVTCLSNPGQNNVVNVYIPSAIDRSLLSCSKLWTIRYNYGYYPYSNKFLRYVDSTCPLSLAWSGPHCWRCEYQGKYCRLVRNSTDGTVECFDPPPTPAASNSRSHKTTTGTKGLVVAGLTVGPFLLLVVVIAAWFHHRSNKLKKEDQVKIERFLEDYRALKPTRYTYAEIKTITEKFKDELGQGGYGTVYKGKLSNDVYIAAKILSNFKGDGDDFINEVGTIGRIHHVNIVRLVGYCADGYKRALVYEYLPNDSLEKFISTDGQKTCPLGWEKMNDIALGIAKGIEYLHQGCDQRILHFDIKPHNILLDKNFNPKISDFGLAKLCSKEQSAVSMTVARGTVGYIAPEVFSRNFGNVSHKSDVYSFGMLLLEMVGGRKNNNDVRTVQNSDEVYFPEWIYNRLNREEENGSEIEEDIDAKIVKKLTVVGLWCIQWYPGDRPSMKAVVQMLEGDTETLAMPPNPFSTTNPPNARGNMGGRAFSSMLEIISESD